MHPETKKDPLMPRPAPARSTRPAKPQKRPSHQRLQPPEPHLCPQSYGAVLSCDWADEVHDLRIWDPSTGQLSEQKILSKPEVLRPFLLDLKKQAGDQQVGVYVESHRGSFINLVNDIPGFAVHEIRRPLLNIDKPSTPAEPKQTPSTPIRF
jgi:hypothetical protein